MNDISPIQERDVVLNDDISPPIEMAFFPLRGLSPSLFMRLRSVEGGTPRMAAAPSGPAMRPRV